jgi:hypothetical protein
MILGRFLNFLTVSEDGTDLTDGTMQRMDTVENGLLLPPLPVTSVEWTKSEGTTPL